MLQCYNYLTAALVMAPPGILKKHPRRIIFKARQTGKQLKHPPKRPGTSYYRFYDLITKVNFPPEIYGNHGMNKFKILQDLQIATQVLIKEELNTLKVQGLIP